MLSIFGWIALFFAIYLWSQRRKKLNSLPPGPFAWPLVGNYVQMTLAHWKGRSLVEWYEECKQSYGSVFTVWVGPMPVVMSVDYETIYEAYVKNGDAHAGRQKSFVIMGYREYMGLIWTDGAEWQEQRRFSLRVLRDFGFGRNLMQQRILEEIAFRFEKLDDEIDSTPGKQLKNFDPGQFLDLLIGSIINKILVGYRYDESNVGELRKLKGGLDKQLDVFTPLDMIVYSKTNYQWPLLKQRYDTVAVPQVEILEHLERLIAERRENIKSGSYLMDPENPNDYIDAYLFEMKKKADDGGMTNFLAVNLLDLYMAGTETSIGAIRWGLVYTLNKPEIQEKLRAEVVKITGGNRFVEITDRTAMPYANAVVTETLRCSNILNFNVLHETTVDTKIGKYEIAKGTVTTPQLCVALRDKALFENPLEFNPDRYLGETTDKQLDKKVIAFGVGKRACLGESLARAEIFLVLTNFVQRFHFSPLDSSQPPKPEPMSYVTNMNRVKPFMMQVKQIHN